jgi:dolichol-phosphate mannosyltransferase
MNEHSPNPPSETVFLLCTYNELGNLPSLITAIHDRLPDAHVLVVDDRSPDGTGDWVRKQSISDSRLFLVDRSAKLGLGSATREGMRWCMERSYKYLIQMDADWSHRPQDAPKLLETCQASGCEVAVGSRYLKNGGFHNIPLHRRIISWCLNRYSTRILRLPVTDCSGSFRCYRTDALRLLDWDSLRCQGYGFLEEILVHLHRSGARFAEVPIRFEPRVEGTSKLTVRDAWGAIRVVHRLALRK